MFFPLFLIFAAVASPVLAKSSDECSCGYFDPSTQEVFTETIIVYFNESSTLPEDTFETQSFIHKKERGWETQYRTGASPDNVVIGNTSQVAWLANRVNPDSLELYVDPYTPEHLVTGGGIKSVREDLQYGTFRASMRSPHPWAGGSALSMILPFNDSQSIQTDLMNTDKAQWGFASNLLNGEGMQIDRGVNYTSLGDGWNYMDIKIDWTKTGVNWTVAQNMTRQLTKHNATIPTVGFPLVFKHWSNGVKTYMQGPPTKRSGANVAWVRAFFNSSGMTTSQHNEFDERCVPSMACSVDDWTLRGSSAFGHASTVAYKEELRNPEFRVGAAAMSAISGSLGVILIINAILRRRDPLGSMKNLASKIIVARTKLSFKNSQDTSMEKSSLDEKSDTSRSSISDESDEGGDPKSEKGADITVNPFLSSDFGFGESKKGGIVSVKDIDAGPKSASASTLSVSSEETLSTSSTPAPSIVSFGSETTLISSPHAPKPAALSPRKIRSSLKNAVHRRKSESIAPDAAPDSLPSMPSQATLALSSLPASPVTSPPLTPTGGPLTPRRMSSIALSPGEQLASRSRRSSRFGSVAHLGAPSQLITPVSEDDIATLPAPNWINQANPFGTATPNPFGTANSNPFGTTSSGPTADEKVGPFTKMLRRLSSSTANDEDLGPVAKFIRRVSFAPPPVYPSLPEAPLREQQPWGLTMRNPFRRRMSSLHVVPTSSNFQTPGMDGQGRFAVRDPVKVVPVPAPQGHDASATVVAQANKRVDYLAGFLSFSCIMVTLVHFALTFIPATVTWGNNSHYKSELWAKRYISPYVFTELWVGPFFATSCRFLSARYLKGGNVADMANKTLLRAPRLLIPVFIIAMIEYFMINLGLTNSMEYLPSVGYSLWPYVTTYKHFGAYVNACIELAYLIPNAAPQIVHNYCMGVLWTIPVQLQNSYTVILGAVMVREVKRPWKRFAFYTFITINAWYAYSWSSCFWMGLMLADLQVTYQWTKYVHARPWMHYSLLTIFSVLALAAPTVTVLNNNIHYDFNGHERGWHPDTLTGLPMEQTPRAGFPSYYNPTLTILVFTMAGQAVVELSTTIQKLLSYPIWIRLFPHVMNIYLMHGLFFWTLGGYIFVKLSTLDVPYWAVVLVTFVCCYACMVMVLKVLTPMFNSVAGRGCKNIWRWASEEPVEKLNTLTPFGKEMLKKE